MFSTKKRLIPDKARRRRQPDVLHWGPPKVKPVFDLKGRLVFEGTEREWSVWSKNRPTYSEVDL
jgi:hypothetical protein